MIWKDAHVRNVDESALEYMQAAGMFLHNMPLETVGRNTNWTEPLLRRTYPRGTPSLKRWLAQHDIVSTLQVTFRRGVPNAEELRVARIWAPLDREIDQSRATYAMLDGSRRDYAGMVCWAATDHVWIGTDGGGTLVAYASQSVV